MGQNPKPESKVVLFRHARENDHGSVVTRVMRLWSCLFADGRLPARAQLSPRALGTALPHAFLVERPRPGTVRVRLAGQEVCHLMGMDLRGMPLRALFEIEDRQRLMAELDGVFTGPRTLSMQLASESRGRADLRGRMLLLPMTGHGGAVDHALGVLVTDGPVGLPPRRFRLLQVRSSAVAAPLPDRPLGAPPGLRLVTGGRI